MSEKQRKQKKKKWTCKLKKEYDGGDISILIGIFIIIIFLSGFMFLVVGNLLESPIHQAKEYIIDAENAPAIIVQKYYLNATRSTLELDPQYNDLVEQITDLIEDYENDPFIQIRIVDFRKKLNKRRTNYIITLPAMYWNFIPVYGWVGYCFFPQKIK